jgi:hypothetical protein
LYVVVVMRRRMPRHGVSGMSVYRGADLSSAATSPNPQNHQVD